METTSDQPDRVLFVCTHNSARSQMAEGMVRAWGGGRFEALSAGTEASHVRPEAIAVMREIGIDISGHTSKTILPFIGESFAWVITVCDAAKEACPTMPGAERQAHWSIDDPSEVEGTEKERLDAFRTARDSLRDRVHRFLLDCRARRTCRTPSRPNRRLSLPLLRSRGDAPRSCLSSLRHRRGAAADLRPMRLALVRQSEAGRRGAARAPGGRRCRSHRSCC